MPTIREALLARLDSIAQLPTMPQVLLSLEQALQDPNSAAMHIATIVREDPSLTASVLRVANSVIYRGRFASNTASVRQAVSRLGFREISRICTSVVLIRTFSDFGRGIDHGEFWMHSLSVATAVRVFGEYTSWPQLLPSSWEEDAFVAGLLHDVGMLVMDQYFPEQFNLIRERAEEKGIPLAKAEERVLGIHHGEIGGILLENWSLPRRVTEAVRWHHDPDLASEANRTIAQMVHLADFVCVNQSIGSTLEGLYDGFSEGAWHDLGLSIDQVPRILEDVKEEAEKSEIMRGSLVSEGRPKRDGHRHR